MVRLTVGLCASSAQSAQDLGEALRFVMASTRIEPGCDDCSVWTDANRSVRYTERWTTAAAMRRRIRSASFTSLLAVMENAGTPPLVQFEFVTRTRGLDYVADVRRARPLAAARH